MLPLENFVHGRPTSRSTLKYSNFPYFHFLRVLCSLRTAHALFDMKDHTCTEWICEGTHRTIVEKLTPGPLYWPPKNARLRLPLGVPQVGGVHLVSSRHDQSSNSDGRGSGTARLTRLAHRQ